MGEIIKARFPGMPLIGFYGNGQISPLATDCHLHQYATAVGLHRAVDPST